MFGLDSLEEELIKINERLVALSANQEKILLEMQRHKELKSWFSKNWWKLSAVVIPVLIMLGEIAIYIRKIA